MNTRVTRKLSDVIAEVKLSLQSEFNIGDKELAAFRARVDGNGHKFPTGSTMVHIDTLWIDYEVQRDVIVKHIISIMKKYDGDNELIPKFKIVNSPSYAKVIMHLKKNQTVYCNYASLNYMDSNIKVHTKTNGVISGIIRSLFTDTSMFQNYFTGTDDKESIISFSSFLPGDIIAMKIKH